MNGITFVEWKGKQARVRRTDRALEYRAVVAASFVLEKDIGPYRKVTANNVAHALVAGTAMEATLELDKDNSLATLTVSAGVALDAELADLRDSCLEWLQGIQDDILADKAIPVEIVWLKPKPDLFSQVSE